MAIALKKQSVTEEDYLQGELKSDTKHEFIQGEIYAMAGASEDHGSIALNIGSEFRNHLKTSPCRTFVADMKVKVNENFYYPDVIVVCEEDPETYYKESPLIVVEVLSPSTNQKDRTQKRWDYLNIPTLQEYVLIEQSFVDIEVIRRNQGWKSEHYYMGDNITFESIELSVSVEDIYLHVKNDDVIKYLEKKSEEKELTTDE